MFVCGYLYYTGMLGHILTFLLGVATTIGALALLGRVARSSSINSRVPTEESVVAIIGGAS